MVVTAYELRMYRSNAAPVPWTMTSEAEFYSVLCRGIKMRQIDAYTAEPIGKVSCWQDAVEVSREQGTLLELLSYKSDTSSSGRSGGLYRTHFANACFQQQLCAALVEDPVLTSIFGPLKVLNDGRGAVFQLIDVLEKLHVCKEAAALLTGGDWVAAAGPGALKRGDRNAPFLFVVQSLHKVKVDEIEGHSIFWGVVANVSKIQDILNRDFHDGLVDPPNVARFSGHPIVPVVAGLHWEAGAEEACHKRGFIYVKEPAGDDGYRVTVPDKVAYLRDDCKWASFDVKAAAGREPQAANSE